MIEYLKDTMGIWYYIILNAIGVIAIIFKVCEYQAKKRSAMFVIATFANLCWVAYFFLYGDYISSLTCLINVVRMLIFAQKGKYSWADSPLWIILFLIVQTGIVIFTVKSLLDICTILAGYLGIFAYFVKDLKKYRLLSFFHMLCWMCNGIFKFYPVALISDTLSTISVSVAIYRYDLSKKSRKLNEKEPSSKE